jgi:hypothetical protein
MRATFASVFGFFPRAFEFAMNTSDPTSLRTPGSVAGRTYRFDFVDFITSRPNAAKFQKAVFIFYGNWDFSIVTVAVISVMIAQMHTVRVTG